MLFEHLSFRGALYLKDFQNYIQIFILASSFLAMAKKDVMLETNNYPGDIEDDQSVIYKCYRSSAEPTRAAVSFGIVLAWFELILVLGRYPFRGGDFSIMFYQVLKKIIRD